MFLFEFLVKISPRSGLSEDEKFKDIAGAYVAAWVHFKEPEGAEMLAKFYIKDAGWTVKKTIDVAKVRKANFTDPADKQSYEEAKKYGYSLIFRMWGKDAEDIVRNYENESMTNESAAARSAVTE